MFRTTPPTHETRAEGFYAAFAPLRVRSTRAEPLAAGDEDEARGFLSERPLHAVNLLSLMRDNGLESPLNRGTFYGYRDERGRLEGVALVGHATLFDARTPRALRALARAAQGRAGLHMVLGESGPVADFWSHYSERGPQPMRLACRELLFQLDRPSEGARGEAGGLRRATPEDVELIIPVQARMAEEESGVNPLARDPEGFRRRCERRIERGRSWVVTEGGELVFKAEIEGETEQVVYLEGIYVGEGERGRGRGLGCLARLTGELLRRVGSVCLLVNERNEAAQNFYRRAGFSYVCHYDTIFLRRD